MNPLLLKIGIPALIVLLPMIIGFVLPRTKTVAYGRKVGKICASFLRKMGRICSLFLRQKLGKEGGEKIENAFQTTLADFATGFDEECHGIKDFIFGLDEDDKK